MVHACVADTHIWYHITMCCILLTVDDILSEELRHCYGLLSPSIRTIPLKDGPSPSTTRVGLLSLSTSVLSLSCDNKERGREHVQSLKTYCARQHNPNALISLQCRNKAWDFALYHITILFICLGYGDYFLYCTHFMKLAWTSQLGKEYKTICCLFE